LYGSGFSLGGIGKKLEWNNIDSYRRNEIKNQGKKEIEQIGLVPTAHHGRKH
jgi:hypothetical protein